MHPNPSIDPVLWGPSAWSLLHAISYHSSSSMDKIQGLFEDLKVLLPCSKCQASYTRHLEMLPFPKRRDAVFKWLYMLHDRINKSLQTPTMIDTPPYVTVQKTWKGKHGINKGIQDSWRFLFFLGMMFPSYGTDAKHRQEYKDALLHWIEEISKTLWNITPPSSSNMRSKTAFRRWLIDVYRTLNHNNMPPKYFLVQPVENCEIQCKL